MQMVSVRVLDLCFSVQASFFVLMNFLFTQAKYGFTTCIILKFKHSGLTSVNFSLSFNYKLNSIIKKIQL